jgi:type II secretory pathway pseudopilin PulG
VPALVVGIDVDRTRPSGDARSSRAFTLVDLLVSIAVVGILIAILLPSLSAVRETAHQVVCRSNVRQFGFGVEMYAEANKQLIPRTITLEANTDLSYRTLTIRFAPGDPGFQLADEQWDGLGLLYQWDYLPAPKVFYCPSHKGSHRYAEYLDQWSSDDGEIVGNFQYRGRGPTGIYGPGGVERMTFRLDQIKPSGAIIVDGLRSVDDFNHRIGANVLRADLSVFWFTDASGLVVESLKDLTSTPNAGAFQSVWQQFDVLNNQSR